MEPAKDTVLSKQHTVTGFGVVRGHGLGEGVLGHERLTPKKQEKVEQLLLYDEVKDKYGGAMGDLRVCDVTYV